MNPVYREMIMSMIRKLVTLAAGYLLTAGIVDEHLLPSFVSETVAIVAGLAFAGGSLGWSHARIWAETYFKRNLAVAGADKTVTTASQVVAIAAKAQLAGVQPAMIIVPVAQSPGEVSTKV